MEDDFELRDLLLIAVASLIALTMIFYGLSWFGVIGSRPLAKYSEETRRQTYEQSASYNQGMAVDLDDLCRQRKISTDNSVKAALADTIRLRAAHYNGELPSYIQECVNEVR